MPVDIIVNGTFSSTSAWNGLGSNGRSISGGTANWVGSGAYNGIWQDITPVDSKWYELTYTITGYVSGSMYASLQGGSGASGTFHSANGTYVERLYSGTGNTLLMFQMDPGGTMSIDDVSLVGPFDAESPWPIVDSFTGANGSMPNTTVWNPATFSAGSTIQSNQLRLVSPGLFAYDGISIQLVPGILPSADFDLRVDYLPQDFVNENYATVANLRDGGSGDRYYLTLNPGVSTLYLTKDVSYSGSVIGSITSGAAWTTGDVVHIHARFNGSAVQVRTWVNGEVEPSTWAISLTDAAFASNNSNQIGLGSQGGSVVGARANVFDNLSLSSIPALAIVGTSIATTSTTTPVNVTLPAGSAVGDLCVAFAADFLGNTSTPSGFVDVPGFSPATSPSAPQEDLRISTRTLTTTDVVTNGYVTLPGSSGFNESRFVVAVLHSSVGTASIDVQSATGGNPATTPNTVATLPGVTTSSRGLVMYAAAMRAPGSPTWAGPASSIVDRATNGTAIHLLVAHVDTLAAGAVASTSATLLGAAYARFAAGTIAFTDTPSGPTPVSATAAWTEDSDTIAVAAANTSVLATAAWAEAADTVAASAAERISATAAWTEAADTIASSAVETIAAASSWTDADDTIAASATYTPSGITASASWAEDDDSVSALATNLPPGSSAVAGWLEDDDIVTVAALNTPPGVAASASWTEDDDIAVGVFVETIAALSSWLEADDTIAASATYTPGGITASASWTEDDDAAVAALVETISAAASWVESDTVAASASVLLPPGSIVGGTATLATAVRGSASVSLAVSSPQLDFDSASVTTRTEFTT